MLKTIGLIFGITLAAAGAAAANETVCDTRESLLKRLAAEYQEAPIGAGLATNGAVVELLTSRDGTWTLIVTPPTGPSCLLGTGERWQPVRKAAIGLSSS